MNKTIGYLGPEGSYSHEVAMYIMGERSKLLALEPSKFVRLLREKKIWQAVLPIANAIGGQVQWVLNLLMVSNGDYEITREIIWNIRSHLIGFGKKGEIRTIYSHSQPLDQCQRFLAKMPSVVTQGMASTSVAVKFVADKKSSEWAAIGTDRAAEMYGVPIIARNISDHDNQTRFVVFAKAGSGKSFSTGKDKTSLLFGIANRPGALLRVLEIFDALAINMNTLFSMPSPNKKLGECFFFVDMSGHRRDKDLSIALDKIKTRVEYLKILGSYPESICVANVD